MTVLPRDVIDAHVLAPLTCADLVHLAMVNGATYAAMSASSLSDYGAARLALVGLCRAVRRYVNEWLTELLLYIPMPWHVIIAIKSSKGVVAVADPTIYIVRRSSVTCSACLFVWQAVRNDQNNDDDDSMLVVGSNSFSEHDVQSNSTRIDAVRELINKALYSSTTSTTSLVTFPYLPPGCVPSTTYKRHVDAFDARQRWLLCPYSAFLAAANTTSTTAAEWSKLHDVYMQFARLWLAAAASSASSSTVDLMEVVAAAASSSTSTRQWHDFIGDGRGGDGSATLIDDAARIVSESDGDDQCMKSDCGGADVLRLILARGDRDSLRDARFEWINESLATCAVTASRVLSNVAPPTPFHDVETDSLIRRLTYAQVARARK